MLRGEDVAEALHVGALRDYCCEGHHVVPFGVVGVAVASEDALERGRVVVSGLAAVGNELVTGVPPGVQRDASWEATLLVGVAHVAPRMASTCGVVGAVVTTKASPGGCTSIHQSASLDMVCDFGTSCDALNAL